MWRGVPLDGLKEFFEFSADGEVGVLRRLICPLNSHFTSVVIVVVVVLAGRLFLFF